MLENTFSPPDPFITEKNWDEYTPEEQSVLRKVTCKDGTEKGIIIVYDRYFNEIEDLLFELIKKYIPYHNSIYYPGPIHPSASASYPVWDQCIVSMREYVEALLPVAAPDTSPPSWCCDNESLANGLIWDKIIAELRDVVRPWYPAYYHTSVNRAQPYTRYGKGSSFQEAVDRYFNYPSITTYLRSVTPYDDQGIRACAWKKYLEKDRPAGCAPYYVGTSRIAIRVWFENEEEWGWINDGHPTYMLLHVGHYYDVIPSSAKVRIYNYDTFYGDHWLNWTIEEWNAGVPVGDFDVRYVNFNLENVDYRYLVFPLPNEVFEYRDDINCCYFMIGLDINDSIDFGDEPPPDWTVIITDLNTPRYIGPEQHIYYPVDRFRIQPRF